MILDSGQAHNVSELDLEKDCIPIQFSKEVLVLYSDKLVSACYKMQIERKVVLSLHLQSGSCTISSDAYQKEWQCYSNNILVLERGTYEVILHNQHARSTLIFVDAIYWNSLIDIPPKSYSREVSCIINCDSLSLQYMKLALRLTQEYQPQSLRYLQLKTNALELIAYSLVTVKSSEAARLKKTDYERVQLVKQIIEQRFAESLTIAMLAREAGTNEQYLKKHFKLLFGNTIYRTILDFRMRKAQDLLKAGDGLKISEVAELIGYKHATHFTTAYKKYYGFKPTQYR